MSYSQCTVNTGLDTTICPGGNASLGGSPTATGVGVIQYSWAPSVGLSCDDCPNPTANPASTQTYTLTITDADNCTSTDQVTVNVANLPNAAFNFLPNNVCAHTTIQFSAIDNTPGLTYSWNFGNPASGGNNTSSQQNPSHLFLANGNGSANFTVTLIVTNGFGCQTVSTQIVTVNQLPEATLVDPIADFRNCDGTNFAMEVYNTSTTSNSNYQIIWGDGTADYNAPTFPSSLIHTYTTADIFDLYFIVTGTNGCTDTLHQTVSNITNPAIGAANPGATTGCGPLVLCFPLSNYTTNHPSTYYIVDYGDSSPNDTILHPPPTSLCHTYSESSCGSAGNAFTFSIQAINLCDNSTATISPIRVYTGPTAQFSANPVPACVNAPVTFSNTSTLGFNSSCANTTIFNWNFGDGATLTQFALSNPSHSYALPGNYTVTLTAQNACGTTSFNQIVCIEAAPTPAFTISPETACIPFSTAVTNTSDTLNSCDVNYTWNVIFNGSSCLPSSGSWNFTGGTNQNSWQPQFQFTSAGMYIVRLTITNSCGSYIFQDTVIGQAPPQITLPALGAICAGESITPVATVNDCYEPSDNYSWNFTGGIPTSSSLLSPGTITYPNPGSFNVTFEASNLCGTVQVTRPLTVNAPPIANAGPDVDFCSGQSDQIGITPVAGINYSWNPATNLSSSTIANPLASGANVTLVPIIQQYVLTASTSPTCFSTDTVLVTVNPIPVLVVNNPTICFGDSIGLLVSGAGAGASYVWNASPDLSCTMCDNPIASPAATTAFSVNGENTFGCSSSINATVTVNPLPIVTVGPDQLLCDQPIPVNLTGTPVGGTWSGSSNVTASGTFTPNGAEIASLIYEYTNPTTNCSNSDTLIITVNPATIPTINPLDSICLNAGSINLSVELNVNPTGGTFAGTGITGVNFNPLVAGVGTHQIIYFFGSSTCESSDTAQIIVHDVPTLLTSNEIICVNDSVSLSVSGAGIGGSYSWTPSISLSCDDCDNPTAWPNATTNYSIIGTTIHGCVSTTNAIVTVNPLPVVNAGANQVLCDQPVPVVLNGTPAGGIWSGSPNLASNGTFIPNGSENVNVVYEYLNPATGCSNSDTVNIIVSPPVVPILTPDLEICFANPVVNLNTFVNPNPVGGTWSGPGVSGTNFNPSIAGVGTQTLSYTFGTGTCQTITTVDIIVNPQPVLASGNAVICVNDTVSLFVSGAGLGGTYSWSPSINLSCDDCDTPNAWPTSTTNYSIQGTNAFGCSATINSVVTVNPLPLVNAGANQVLCDQPIPVIFSGTPAGGVWSGSPNLASDGTFVPNGSENVNVMYEYTNPSTGCTNSDTINVVVSPPVVPTILQNQEICFEAATVNLNAFLTPNPLGGTWSGAGVVGANFNPSVVGVGTHSLSYTFGTGTCQTITTIDLVVNPQPTIVSNNEIICVGETVTLFADGAGAGGSYAWTPNTNLSCDDCQNPDASPVSTINYIVTGTNAFGCSNTATANVIVNPLPIANAGSDTTLCNLPATVQFTGTQPGGTWSGPNIAPNGIFTPNGIGTFTVTYTVVLGTGCTNSDDKIITVIDPAQANAGADDEACILNSTVNLTGLPAGGTWSGTNVTAAGVFSLNQAGTFELVYTYGEGNCLTRDTMEFIVHPLPIVNAGQDEEICISEAPINLSGTPANGVWSGNGITDANLGTFDPAVAMVGTHLITYTYTHPVTNCINSDQLNVIVRPLPVVNFTVDPIVCLGNNVVFTNTSTLISTSDWDFGDNSTSNAQNPTHTYSSIGFFDVQLIVTTAFGCQDSVKQTIEVREPPVANFTVAPDSVCGPLLATFANLSSGVNITYDWDFGNGQTSTVQNPAPVNYLASLTSDTSYLITLSVTNYCGTVTHQESVIVMPQPLAIFGTDFNTGCSPFTANFASTSVGLPDSYFWDFGDGTTATTTDSLFSHVFTTGAAPTDYEVMLVVYNECGSDTAYHTITVLPNSVNAFFNTSVTSGCEDLTVSFTQYTLGGTFYNWNFGDGNTSTAYSPTHTFTDPGTYTVALMANDGCSFDTTEVQITVFPSPVLSFTSSPDSVCINSPFDFVNTSPNLANSSWDFGDGSTSNLTNPSHQYGSPGNYVVTLTGTSLTNGCTAQLSQTVNVSLNPIAAFNATPLSGCMPLQVQLTNTSVNATYSFWDFGDGNTSGLPNPTHTFINAGVYTIQLVVENSNGCKDSVIQNITVYPLPVADFTYQSTSTCYTPTNFTFTNQSTGAINYAWDFGDGAQSTLTNPLHTYQNPGDYTIALVATNQYGCISSTSQTVTIYPTPEAAFNLPTDVVCENDVLVFQSNSNFADSIVWNFGNGQQLVGNTVQFEYPNSGVFNVTIMAYGAGGCGDTLTVAVPITVHPKPTADFSYVNVQIPDPVSGTVEFTNLSTDADTYLWEFGNGESSTEVNPIHRFNSYGEFQTLLIATNSFGCVDSFYQAIRVTFFNGLYLPNAMYPGHSDYEVSHFVPKGVGLKEYLVQIYDDWGNLIWQSNALDINGRPTEGWDGTYKGQPVQQDAYVWKVVARFLDESVWEGKEYENGVYKRAGTVTVIR